MRVQNKPVHQSSNQSLSDQLSTTPQQEKSKIQQLQQKSVNYTKIWVLTLLSPLARLRDDLSPLLFELKTLRQTQIKIPSLDGKKKYKARVSKKMHLLQIKMAIQEMILTRRARKSGRIQEKYQANQMKLTREFAKINPRLKKILSKEAQTTLKNEMSQLEKDQAKATQKSKSVSKS